MSFGKSLIEIFVPIYLYYAGFPIYQIIFYYFLIALYFVIFSHIGAKIVSRVGEKHSILLSAPLTITYYIGLTYLQSHHILFFILPFVLALNNILFNFGYHLNFLNHSNKKTRGITIALLGVVVLIASSLSPLLGGVIAQISFPLLYFISSMIIICGTIPLFLTKDTFVQITFTSKDIFKNIFKKSNRGNLISFSSYAIESYIGFMLWPLFLILTIGSIAKTGLIMSLSVVSSLLLYQIIGKMTDRFDKMKLLKIGTFLYFLAWVGRIFADTVYKIFFIDSYKNISEKILQVPLSAHSYDLAERGDYFAFIVAQETTYNLTRILVFPVLIVIFLLGFHPFTLSFIIASFSSLGYFMINK